MSQVTQQIPPAKVHATEAILRARAVAKSFRMGDDFNWTIGSDESLVHQKKLDIGAYGEVHQVTQI